MLVALSIKIKSPELPGIFILAPPINTIAKNFLIALLVLLCYTLVLLMLLIWPVVFPPLTSVCPNHRVQLKLGGKRIW